MDRLLEMSAKELSRLEVMQRLSKKQMRQKEAGRILDLSTRQIKRLLRAYRAKGAAGLVSKQRGRRGNNRLPEEIKKRALNLLKTKYKGFGPTLAHEKLVEKEKLKFSDESVRKLMIEEELWKPRKAKKVVIHQLRERRACFGELIQIDGSPHDWFEGRAPTCVLLVFIDDATGKLVQLQLVEQESFFSYCQAAEGYFRQYGKPVAFYSDKHGIFRVNLPSTGVGQALTQFGRAMQELNIQIICANSPQAKGRVERVIQTLQDRLPKELRLRNISNMTKGNAYLPEFLQDFNQRFAVEARSSVNAHRPLTTKEDLTRILTWQETRTLSKNLTLQFHKTVYQIQTNRPSYALRNAQVTVCVNAQEELTILYHGNALPFSIYNHQAKQAEVVSTKQLDAALQSKRLPPKPAPDHPWRRGFATPLSKRRSVTPAPTGDISILENR
ncbi:MAG TPA: ISNCY family transposase [Candidatus Saccharimonadales bacterium]|nr:ISNCY family transposase [Candidatus Saccharimonadales bacterium]